MSFEGDVVKLDVGGMVFKTTRATLLKYDGMFRKMMVSDEMKKVDENGCIFIDRDPSHFRLILNFMRDGDVDLPDSVKEIQEIRKEAEYYGLEKLIRMCEQKKPIEVPSKFKTIESEYEMVQIITNPKKPVLIIHYKLDNWQNATKYFDVTKFQTKYAGNIDIYFKISTNINSAWSYSIHDRVPNIFSNPKTCQENNFLWDLENAIGRFLENRKKYFT